MRRRVIFQSTLPLRGATAARAAQRYAEHISIHAPLAGSDLAKVLWMVIAGYFNPRSPCGERLVRKSLRRVSDRISIHAPLAGSDQSKLTDLLTMEFQSTLPLRGATRLRPRSTPHQLFQSTLPLRGAT